MKFPIAFIAFVFFWMENEYFGWNGKPQSEAELICDGIVFLIFALSLK
jgi:hypothetical protein